MSNHLLKTSLKIPLFALVVGVGSLLEVSNAAAEACTYREAIMALERGNVDRGLALMRMASRDGDRRAENYLLAQDYAERIAVKDSVITAVQPSLLSASSEPK